MTIKRFPAILIAVLTLLVGLTSGPRAPMTAQTAAAPAAPAPRLPSGKPNLSGVWMPPYVPDMTKNERGQQGRTKLSYTPAASRNGRRTTRRTATTPAAVSPSG